MEEKPDSPHSPTERYSQRGNPAFEAVMAQRTAEREAAFFLPHLCSGMRLLDVGCGPGSITLGLAETVEPGAVVGLDFQELQIRQAQSLADAHGITNLHFQVGDAYQLPFPDGSFDAVFAHAVLWHLREPVKALTEMRRVLRPDGIVGIRDCDWGGRIYAPSTPLLDQWWAHTVKIREHNSGNPFLGRHLRRLLREAGFERVTAAASTWTAGTREEVASCATFLKAQLGGFASTAVSEGLIDRAGIERVAAEIDTWAKSDDAFYVDTYCEAVGFS